MSEFKAIDTALRMLYRVMDDINPRPIKPPPADLAICRNCNWAGNYEKLRHITDDRNCCWIYVCPECESSDWCSTLEYSVDEEE